MFDEYDFNDNKIKISIIKIIEFLLQLKLYSKTISYKFILTDIK
jgi:hypothetical protein